MYIPRGRLSSESQAKPAGRTLGPGSQRQRLRQMTATHGTCAVDEAQRGDCDCDALRRPVDRVEVVKVTREALVPHAAATQGEGAVCADGEARRVDGAALRRIVELELVVRGNIAGATLGVFEDRVVER